jgi:three-Cys-motif partner protein
MVRKTAEAPALPEAYRGREQTYVKHVILREYLERVAWNILSFKRDFVFVDGFSGPWKSARADHSDTSFGIAIKQLRKVQRGFADKGTPKDLRCIFVERGAHAFRKLEAAAKGAQDLRAEAMQGRFEDHADLIRQRIGNAFSLVFVDPTGWSFDLKKIAPLLRHEPGEVLVNFMFEHFRRFIDDKRADIRATHALPFGDANWRFGLDRLLASGLSQEEAVLRLFKDKLKEHCGFKYVASARVQHRLATKTHFFLVYGTRNPKGLEEFRKVEKSALEIEATSRVEAKERDRQARTDQQFLFSAAEMAQGAPVGDCRAPDRPRAEAWIFDRLSGYPTITFEKALEGVQENFSLTVPEFKDVLVDLAKRGCVEFDGMAGKRKPDKGVTIRRA